MLPVKRKLLFLHVSGLSVSPLWHHRGDMTARMPGSRVKGPVTGVAACLIRGAQRRCSWPRQPRLSVEGDAEAPGLAQLPWGHSHERQSWAGVQAGLTPHPQCQLPLGRMPGPLGKSRPSPALHTGPSVLPSTGRLCDLTPCR